MGHKNTEAQGQPTRPKEPRSSPAKRSPGEAPHLLARIPEVFDALVLDDAAEVRVHLVLELDPRQLLVFVVLPRKKAAHQEDKNEVKKQTRTYKIPTPREGNTRRNYNGTRVREGRPFTVASASMLTRTGGGGAP